MSLQSSQAEQPQASWINPPYHAPRSVFVEGLIGVGKTTLVRQLSAYLGYCAIEEPVQDNELLSAFYADPKQYAFMFQIHMLSTRCALQRAAQYQLETGQITGYLADRSLAGDTVFEEVNARIGNITPEGHRVYQRLYALMKYESAYPDVLVYLHAPLEVVMRRIQERSRDCEHGIPESYMRLLESAYMRFVEAMTQFTTVLVLDWSEYRDAAYVWDKVLQAHGKGAQDRFFKTMLRF